MPDQSPTTAQFDLVLRGGTIVDGLRTPRYRGDVAISDGRVAAMGTFHGSGVKEIDATGLIVAPGAIDLHTHYDAQIFWDPWCTVSGWHGVTSVTIGNCGFGFAPVAAKDRDRAMLTMARNEAVPLECMQEGMPWDWESFPEYLDSLDRAPKGVNVMSYVGLNPIMTYVMGFDDDSKGRAATQDELERMCSLLEEAFEAGACGFSTQAAGDTGAQRDSDGTPMITDLMAESDLLAFADTLGRTGRGFIQMLGSLGLAERVARRSGRPIIWNILTPTTDQHGAEVIDPDTNETVDYRRVIEIIDELNQQKGLRVFAQAQTADANAQFTFEDWNLWDRNPVWREATIGTVQERMVKLADEGRRAQMRAEFDAGMGPFLAGRTDQPDAQLDTLKLAWVTTDDPSLKKYEGYTVAEIAAETGKHPIDAMLDIAVADGLRAGFETALVETPLDAMTAVATSHYALPGVSDGGAHTKFLTCGAYVTEFIAKWTRDKQIMDIEEAHWRLSTYPAMASGFDRGWLTVGAPADIMVYDLDSLEMLRPERSYDLPAGAWRLTLRASGYRYMIVNGEVTFIDGEPTGALPGRLLRHGALS
jgi:N-acyl-D-amino-acid deacylase